MKFDLFSQCKAKSEKRERERDGEKRDRHEEMKSENGERRGRRRRKELRLTHSFFIWKYSLSQSKRSFHLASIIFFFLEQLLCSIDNKEQQTYIISWTYRQTVDLSHTTFFAEMIKRKREKERERDCSPTFQRICQQFADFAFFSSRSPSLCHGMKVDSINTLVSAPSSLWPGCSTSSNCLSELLSLTRLLNRSLQFVSKRLDSFIFTSTPAMLSESAEDEEEEEGEKTKERRSEIMLEEEKENWLITICQLTLKLQLLGQSFVFFLLLLWDGMLFFGALYLVCAWAEYQVATAFILTPIVLPSINEMKTTFADARFPRQINKTRTMSVLKTTISTFLHAREHDYSRRRLVLMDNNKRRSLNLAFSNYKCTNCVEKRREEREREKEGRTRIHYGQVDRNKWDDVINVHLRAQVPVILLINCHIKLDAIHSHFVVWTVKNFKNMFISFLLSRSSLWRIYIQSVRWQSSVEKEDQRWWSSDMEQQLSFECSMRKKRFDEVSSLSSSVLSQKSINLSTQSSSDVVLRILSSSSSSFYSSSRLFQMIDYINHLISFCFSLKWASSDILFQLWLHVNDMTTTGMMIIITVLSLTDRCLLLFYSLKRRASVFISLYFTKEADANQVNNRVWIEIGKGRRLNLIWTEEMRSSSRRARNLIGDIYLYAHKLIKDNKGVHSFKQQSNLFVRSNAFRISSPLASSSSMTQPRWMPSVSHLGLRCECPSVTRNSFDVWCYFEFKWPFHSLFLIDANASSHTSVCWRTINRKSVCIMIDDLSGCVCVRGHTRSTWTTDARCFINLLSFRHLTRFHIGESEREEKQPELTYSEFDLSPHNHFRFDSQLPNQSGATVRLLLVRSNRIQIGSTMEKKKTETKTMLREEWIVRTTTRRPTYSPESTALCVLMR